MPFDKSFGNLNDQLKTGYWAFNIGSIDGMCYSFLSKRMNSEFTVDSPTKEDIQGVLKFNKKARLIVHEYINEEDDDADDQKQAYYHSVKNNMELINASSIEARVNHCEFLYVYLMFIASNFFIHYFSCFSLKVPLHLLKRDSTRSYA